MARYAQETSVSSTKSRGEIERILARYGAEQFAYGWDQETAIIGFIAHGRQIRFRLPLPDRNDRSIRMTPTGRWRSEESIDTAYEQAVKQRWRALVLIIKAKLEAVESGIVSFEEEFLAQTALPSGQSVSEWLEPQIEEAYQHGQMPELLPSSRPAIER